MISRKNLRLALLVLVSTVSFGAAIYVVGPQTILLSASGIGAPSAVLAGLLVLLNTFIVFFRFRSILAAFGYKPGWRDALLAFTTGQISNQILLNVVGQSLSRAAALTSAGIPFGVSVVATYWERVMAAGLLFVLSLAGALYLFLNIGIDLKSGGAYLVSLISGIVLVSVVVLAVFLHNREFRTRLPAIPRQMLRFWPAALLTLAAHGAMAAAYAVLLSDLGLPHVTLGVLAALSIVMFTASLPISFSGWGIRELSAAQALAVVGVSSPVAVAAAVVIGLLGMLIVMLGGGIALYLYIHRRRRRAPAPVIPAAVGPNGIDHDRWLSIAATGATVLSAILLYFQIRLPSEHGEITANAADILALTGLGFLLMFAWSRGSFRPLPGWLIGTMAAISLVFLFSLGLGYIRFGSNSWALMNRGFGWVIILGYVSLGALLALTPQRGGDRLVLSAFILAGVTVAALQIILLIAVLFGLTLPADAFIMPLRGYASNSNAFAFQMVMAAICIVVAGRIRLGGFRPAVYNVALVVVSAAIYYSLSRAGLGMMAIVLILMVTFAQMGERKRALQSALSVVVTYLLLLTVPDILDAVRSILRMLQKLLPAGINLNFTVNNNVAPFLVQSLSRDSSDSERWLTIVQGWDLWLQHPIFGSGLGAYVQSRIDSGQIFLVIHSVPVWLLAETGLIGLAVLFVVLAVLVRCSFQMMSHRSENGWGAGLLFMLACMSAAGLVHDLFFQRPFWFLLGLFIAVAARHATERPDDRSQFS